MCLDTDTRHRFITDLRGLLNLMLLWLNLKSVMRDNCRKHWDIVFFRLLAVFLVVFLVVKVQKIISSRPKQTGLYVLSCLAQNPGLKGDPTLLICSLEGRTE